MLVFQWTSEAMAMHHLASKQIHYLVCVGLVFRLQINQVMSSQCGTVNFLQPTILKGTPTLRGEWPFIAALVEQNNDEFFCGGTLISAKHVMTAAHCVKGKFIVDDLAIDIVVILGAYDLSTKNETGTLRLRVIDVYVHPDWKDYELNYDADIAILVLSETVTFSNQIRPICVPSDDVITDGVRGSIVGWGLTENGTYNYLKYPRRAFTNALNASYCLTTDPELAYISSTRSFCGRGEEGGPNKGDSGGGFFVLYGSVWVQYGIISALRINASGIVDVNSFAIYTNVKLFENWINETVRGTGGVVMTATEKVNINCLYDENFMWGYTCIAHNLSIRTEKVDVTFTGVHANGRTNLDVKRIEFFNGTMFYLPDTEKFFKNLESIQVNPKLNFKYLRRENFRNLKHLTDLEIYGNDITTIDEDTLWDLPNLVELNAHTNQLKALHEKTFEKNSKLRVLSLSRNNIETLHVQILWGLLNLEGFYIHTNKLEALHRRTFEKNPSLIYIEMNKNVIGALHESTFWGLPNLEELNAHTNKLKVLHERTFEKNAKLRVLSLSINDIETLHEKTLWGLPNLEGFYIHTNKLQVLHQKTFEKNPSLIYIEINKNDIETLDEKTLWALPDLEEFYIHTNKLKVLGARTFEKNAKLREIYLGSNQFEFLHRDLFKSNVVLEVVDFSANRLTMIDVDFSKFKKLHSLNFVDNVCINTQFVKNSPRSNYRHLEDFQSLIAVNCSS